MELQYLTQHIKDNLRKNEYGLQPYIISDGKKHPVAVICPGGAYNFVCGYSEGKPIAKKLNKMGISAVVVYYRVKDKALYPNPQDDLAKAIREIFTHKDKWNLDIENYSVWGFSAGGHLAASFGTEDMGYLKYDLPKPQTLVLCYPVITMTDLTHQQTRTNLLGKDFTNEQIDFASVEKQVTNSYPDTFVWVGDSDQVVPYQNSLMLDEQLSKHGIRHQLVVYPGIDHGVGIAKGMSCEDWMDKAVRFWLKGKYGNE